jgi:hypothetical protein
MASTNNTYTTAGANNWYAPHGVSNVVVEGWGGGGAGANRTTAGQGGGGEGGGYAKLNSFSATAGTTYALVVGAGGNSNNASNGVSTTFNSTSLVAVGGNSVALNTATGATAHTSGSTGDVKNYGGGGVTGNNTIWGGGGGSSGGTGASGRAGQGNTGGGNGTDSANLPAGAGAGGNGGKSNGSVGSDGVAPGGAGGGAARANSTNRKGGNGATGKLIITYDYTPNAISMDGSTQYGTLSNFAGIANLTGTETIEGWFYNDSTSGAYAYAAAIYDATYKHAQIQTENGTGNTGTNFGVDYASVSADGYNNSSTIFAQNTWVHIALVGTLNDYSKLYLNGTEISYTARNTPSGALASPYDHNFYIGAKPSYDTGASNWKGRAGGFVRVWNRALSGAEINSNKNKQLTAANEQGLIINLKFTEGSGTSIANEANGSYNMSLTGAPPWTPGPPTSAATYTAKTVTGKANIAAPASTKTVLGQARITSTSSKTILGKSNIILKADSITDNFDDNSLDAKWTSYGFTSGSVAESSQTLRFTSAANTNASESGIYSTNKLNFTGTRVSIQGVTMPSGHCYFDFGIQLEAQILENSDANFILIGVDTGTGKLQASKKVSNSFSVVAEVTYNSTNHKYWALRESGGTMYWEYSSDGSSWNTLWSEANPFAVTAAYMLLDNYEYDATTAPTVGVFDNVNIVLNTSTKTIAGQSRIAGTTSKTLLGRGRVEITSTKTLDGKSRITVSTPKTLQGISRVTVSTPKTLAGKSRVTVSTPKTVQGISRVTVTTPKTILGRGSVSAPTIKTVQGISRVTASTPKTILGKGAILGTTPKTITGKGRVQITSTTALQGKSRVTVSTPKTILGISRIGLVTPKTILGKSRIEITSAKTIAGKSRVEIISSKTVQGKSNILVTGTSSKTVQGISRVTAAGSQTIQGKGRIELISSKTIQGKSRVELTSPKTIQGQSKISIVTAKTIQGVSNINTGPSSSSKTIQGKSNIVGWYNDSWHNRVKVTVLASKVDADLTGFPVLVNLADLPAGFHTNVNQTDARDIRVTKADGATEVPREVVYYDAATDKGELHFKGDIDGDVDTDFYIYYGNSSASDYAIDSTYGAENVWDSSTLGVWHMNNPSATIYDSTTNDLDAVAYSNSGGTGTQSFEQTSPGKIGKNVKFNDENSALIVPDQALLDVTSMTMQGWFYCTNATSEYIYLFGRWLNSGTNAWSLWMPSWNSNNFDIRLKCATSPAYTFTSINGIFNNWFFVALRYDSATHRMSLWLNGSEAYNNSASFSGDIIASNEPLSFGNTTTDNTHSSTLYGFNGNQDEFRFSNVARSDAWMSTTYNNQNSPSTFYNPGAQETTETITTKTITGTARIELSTTKTLTGKSSIAITADKTISGVSRIAITGTKTVQGKARVAIATGKTIQGKSRIGLVSSQVIPGKARITSLTSQTIAGKAKIIMQAVAAYQSITGHSRITTTVGKTISGVAKVNVISDQEITGLSRITANTARTIKGTACIFVPGLFISRNGISNANPVLYNPQGQGLYDMNSSLSTPKTGLSDLRT